jgi:hypothetical protein
MLYRSAYAERTKQWCQVNRNQVVSALAGESWRLESSAVRELYIEYAHIERLNHQDAHPMYRFLPRKRAASSQKRKKTRLLDERCGSDVFDARDGRFQRPTREVTEQKMDDLCNRYLETLLGLDSMQNY